MNLHGCIPVQAELQNYLQDILTEAGVEHVDELLSTNVAKGWARTARVNLLKISVDEALTWLRSPPSPHQKLAALVCCHRLQAAACMIDANHPRFCDTQGCVGFTNFCHDWFCSGIQGQKVTVDELLPDVLFFPAGSDLHDHPLVTDGSLILQVWHVPYKPNNDIKLPFMVQPQSHH